MLSFKVNPVYTNLGILLKLRKDVPEIEFRIQVLNETGKFRSDFTTYSIKIASGNFTYPWSVGKEVNKFFYSPAE